MLLLLVRCFEFSFFPFVVVRPILISRCDHFFFYFFQFILLLLTTILVVSLDCLHLDYWVADFGLLHQARIQIWAPLNVGLYHVVLNMHQVQNVH